MSEQITTVEELEALIREKFDILPTGVRVNGTPYNHAAKEAAESIAARYRPDRPVGPDVERLIERAEAGIANAFEAEGEAWSDKLSGDRLARIAARALYPLFESLRTASPVGPDVEGMDQRAAFDETVALAESVGMPEHGLIADLDLSHLRSMQAQIAAGDFSPSKLGRWLGWAQAALVSAHVGVRLEDVKQINRRHTGTTPLARPSGVSAEQVEAVLQKLHDERGPMNFEENNYDAGWSHALYAVELEIARFWDAGLPVEEEKNHG